MRARRIALVAVVIVVVLATAALFALPSLVKLVAQRQIESVTGRPAAIGRVELDLFRRHLVVRDFRLAGEPGRPLAEFARLDTRFRLRSLVRGRVDLDTVTLESPVLRVERDHRGRFSVADVIERILARPAGDSRSFSLGRLVVDRGRIVFEDHLAAPAYIWEATPVSIEVTDVGTEVSHGRARVLLTLAGAQARVELADIGVRPLIARFSLAVDGFDLGVLRRYVPPETAIVLSGGRLSTRVEGRYSASEGLAASSDTTVTDLALARRDQETPFVTTPTMTIAARDLSWVRGIAGIGRVEIAATPTIIDTSVSPPERFEPGSVSLVVEGVTHPARDPARVTLTAHVPENGRIDVRGTVAAHPFAMDLAVALAGVKLTLARAHFPLGAAVTLEQATLGATLRLRDDATGAVSVDGDFTIADLLLARRGQTEPLVRDTMLRGTLAGLTIRGGDVDAGEITLEGAPTITDASTGAAQRFELSRFRARARDLTWPGRRDARVALDAEITGGGKSSVRGTIQPGTLSARARVQLSDVDLARLTPYLPANAPVALGRGRLTATAEITHDRETGVRINAQATIADLVLLRRGQADAFVADPSLAVGVVDLVVKEGTLTASRVTVAGRPTVIEASGRTRERVDFISLAGTITNVGWPARAPMRVRANAITQEGSVSTLVGSLEIATLAARARATFAGLDLTRVNAYLPPDSAVIVAGGRVGATVRLTHDRATGLKLAADGVVSDAALARRGESEPFVHDGALAFTVTDLTIKDDAYAVKRVTLSGTPALTDRSVSPPRSLAIPSLSLVGEDLTWRGAQAGRITLDVRLPDAGTLTARGAVRLAARALDAHFEIRDAAVAPFTPFLPISTQIGGRVDASFDVRGGLGAAAPGDQPQFVALGTARAREITVGPESHVSIAGIDLSGIELQWPRGIAIEKVLLRQLSALVERAEDGSFPLRAMLTARPAPVPRTAPSASRSGDLGAGATATAGADQTTSEHFTLSIKTFAIDEGDLRFVDRGTKPFYSEEVTELAFAIRDLTTTRDRHADVTVHGVVGGHAALDLKGVVAPFIEPFFLDIVGELRDFTIARTNPYLEYLIDWVATSGRLTTHVHYRIVGDELHATNEILVQRLGVEPAGTAPDRLVGVPLSLVVSLLKDVHGDIHLNVPIEGRLSSRHWSFGDTLRSALKRVLAHLVAAPFRAIGSVFHHDDGEKIRELRVDPLVFSSGSAALTPEGERQIQRVADFLRASPHARIALTAVISGDDLVTLRGQRIAALIQRVQRDRNIADFDTAARQLFATELPNEAPPKTTQEIIAALAHATPDPERRMHQLVTRRLQTARQALIDAAGVDPERLVVSDGEPTIGTSGTGRVEFKLLPS